MADILRYDVLPPYIIRSDVPCISLNEPSLTTMAIFPVSTYQYFFPLARILGSVVYRCWWCDLSVYWYCGGLFLCI